MESSGWDLDVAIGSFYEADDMDIDDIEAVRSPKPAATSEKPPEKAKEPAGSSPSNPATGSGSAGASSRPMSNINTFSSRFGSSSKADNDDSSDSEEEGQAFFAGGSEQSGQQILGPGKKKDGADFVKHMFKKAKEHGAEAVDPGSGGAQASGSRSAFTGSGFKLGSNGKKSEGFFNLLDFT